MCFGKGIVRENMCHDRVSMIVFKECEVQVYHEELNCA